MDATRRIAILQAQVDEADGGDPSDFEGWRQRTAAALRVTMGPEHASMKAFQDVTYSLGFFTDVTPDSAFRAARYDGVKDAIAILEGAIHEVGLTQPAGPGIYVSGLHPWIEGAVAGLWDDGHFRSAVDEATRKIELQLKLKLGSHKTGVPLITDAFSPSEPRDGERRLRFLGYEAETPSWTNAHEGAMFFGRGCMMRIRNLLEHEDEIVDKQVGAECLAALSLLARWIDEAEVVDASDD